MRFIKKYISVEMMKFLVTGGVNTAFSFISFVFFMELIGIKEIAATINLLVGISFNYLTYSRFVFKESKRNLKQMLQFYCVYFITYPIGLVHLFVTVDLIGIGVYQSRIISTCYMPFISHYLQRKIVFKKIEDNE